MKEESRADGWMGTRSDRTPELPGLHWSSVLALDFAALRSVYNPAHGVCCRFLCACVCGGEKMWSPIYRSRGFRLLGGHADFIAQILVSLSIKWGGWPRCSLRLWVSWAAGCGLEGGLEWLVFPVLSPWPQLAWGPAVMCFRWQVIGLTLHLPRWGDEPSPACPFPMDGRWGGRRPAGWS